MFHCRTLRAVSCSFLTLSIAAADAMADPPASAPVEYAIVVTGGELLAGAYADGHTLFLTQALRPLGLRCVGSMCVDDKAPDIQDALRFCEKKVQLVIVTGGLGPTDNDITRETLSDFSGIELREHAEVVKLMERRFNQPIDQIRANLRRQTRVPVRGTYLKNSNGTAAGLVFEPEKLTIVALPGPPQELQPMVREELVPYLNRRFGTRLSGYSLTLRFVGIGQSAISQTMKDHVSLPADVVVTSQFDGARVDFTFTLPQDTPENRQRLDEVKRKIVPHLEEYFYAENETSLEQHVIGLLKSRGERIVLVEVASGGALAAALSPADGGAGVLAGAYAAPTYESLRSLIGVPDTSWNQAESVAQKLELLASAAAERTHSRWAVVVGATRQDANSTTGADVVIRLPDGRVESVFAALRGSGDVPRHRLTTQVLDRLRRRAH